MYIKSINMMLVNDDVPHWSKSSLGNVRTAFFQRMKNMQEVVTGPVEHGRCYFNADFCGCDRDAPPLSISRAVRWQVLTNKSLPSNLWLIAGVRDQKGRRTWELYKTL